MGALDPHGDVRDAGPVSEVTEGRLAGGLPFLRTGQGRRLVLASAACRLSPTGRRVQGELARRTEAGDGRRAWAPVAEVAAVFDAEPHPRRVRATTLVLGGGADPFYTEDLFRCTAAGEPDGRAVVFSGKGHLFAASSRTSVAVSLGCLLAGSAS